MKLQELKQEGLSISEISSCTGHDRKTVRKYLQNPKTPLYGPRKPRPRILDGWRETIAKRTSEGLWNAKVLHREMRDAGFTGSYTVVKDYLTPLRKEARNVAVRRFETPPGRQGQVDWGVLGHVQGGRGRKSVLGFVFTLGSSRAMFAGTSPDQALGSLIRLHEEAFAYLGGIPEEILYDNMKTVTEGRDERDEIRWNPTFLDFARYWGFEPRLCRPYRPQTKGKVESGIRYLRKSFLCSTAAQTVEQLDTELRAWLHRVANQRVHGTTHRLVWEALLEERERLTPVGGRPPYPYGAQHPRLVARDAYVSFRTNRYSVPWQMAGKQVVVHLQGLKLSIERDGETIATHALCPDRFQNVTQAAHLVGMPYGPGSSRRKVQVTLSEPGPTVQIRDLSEYEAFAENGIPASRRDAASHHGTGRAA